VARAILARKTSRLPGSTTGGQHGLSLPLLASPDSLSLLRRVFFHLDFRYFIKTIEEGRAASKSPHYKFGYFLYMSQQAVSANIIPNSVVGIFIFSN
jgi:hypothetical protein